MITCLKNKGEIEEYGRAQMNEIATEFYPDLYSAAIQKSDFSISIEDGTAPDPPFLEEDIRRAVVALKEGKAVGHDGITNEHVKFEEYL